MENRIKKLVTKVVSMVKTAVIMKSNSLHAMTSTAKKRESPLLRGSIYRIVISCLIFPGTINEMPSDKD